MATVEQIIATINPDLYYDTPERTNEERDKKLKEFKQKIKEEGFQKAANSAKGRPALINPITGKMTKNPDEGIEAKHELVYDSSSEQLEPLYFFILDLMNDFGLDTKKIVDNFSASPGSGHFSEMGQRASIMQQQGQKLLTDIGTVMKSVINIVYDLKEFKTRLQYYDDLKSDNKDTREAARLSLKQLWMDKVDMQKGGSSIKQMALGQAGFTTLIDAFLAVEDESLKDKNGNEVDINDRIKRILRDRIREFNTWVKNSEEEIRKRYQVERNYLKSQVNSLKLYVRWARPYLEAAQKLQAKQIGGEEPSLVKAFNTLLLELTLMGKQKVSLEKAYDEEAYEGGRIPKTLYKKEKEGKLKRNYYQCILVDFRFRSIPQRVSQGSHYAFGGRAEATFKAYALNEDELEKLKEEMGKADIEDAMSLIEGATTESLEQIQEDINEFLKEEEGEKEKKKKEKTKDQSNPFLALFGSYDKKSSGGGKTRGGSKKEKEKKEIPKESWWEKEFIRKVTAEQAGDNAFNLFDVYKKSHGMPSYT